MLQRPATLDKTIMVSRVLRTIFAMLLGLAPGCVGPKVENMNSITRYQPMLRVQYPDELAQETDLAGFFPGVDVSMASSNVDRVLRRMSELAWGPVLEKFLEEREMDPTLNRVTRINAGALLQRWQTLAALNSDTVFQFVDDAVRKKDADALCAALNALTLGGAASPVVDGLRRLEDRTTVPALGLSLSVVASSFGVNLAPSMRDSQARRTYAALFRITGVWPADANDVTEEAVYAYLQQVEYWLVEYVPALEAVE